MNVPDAAIEAAAEALHDRRGDECFHSEGGTVVSCERDASAAISAAMPAIREALAQEIEAYPGWLEWDGLRTAARIVRGGTP